MSKYQERIEQLQNEITLIKNRAQATVLRLEGAIALAQEFAKAEQEEIEAKEKASAAMQQMFANMDQELEEAKAREEAKVDVEIEATA